MSTIPDMRDIPLGELELPKRSISPGEVKQCIGYICASAVCICALLIDGIVALSISGAVAGAMVGIEIGKRV